ncbi:hypothetical protein PIB30_000712 [Stylosanthes scabra]|uniref:Uncharacterized protein n=1 Tax=Stylosanthes scabra TaxID=79078 RepID=A0ABU6Z150_9FABA|nr:hypothetical protein [Stylosanthes scabra]
MQMVISQIRAEHWKEETSYEMAYPRIACSIVSKRMTRALRSRKPCVSRSSGSKVIATGMRAEGVSFTLIYSFIGGNLVILWFGPSRAKLSAKYSILTVAVVVKIYEAHTTYVTISSFFYLSYAIRPIAPFSPRPAASPSSSTCSGSVGSIHRERSRSLRTPLPPMAPASVPVLGPVYPVPRTPMCDARHYRSLFPHRRVAPPTPPPPSPPLSDEEPFAETYDPATELVGDPDEPYVAEHVPYGAPEAYYSDTSYGSQCGSASTDTAPSSHHSSGSSSGSVSLGYGSASSGSASDGASDDDMVNRYFAGTFPLA